VCYKLIFLFISKYTDAAFIASGKKLLTIAVIGKQCKNDDEYFLHSI
jgi:hypothetical protein